MPEDNGPPTNPPGARGQRRTSVNTPTRVEVERINPRTGHTIDAHEDLLNEIKKCCEDQTQILARKLDDIKDAIRQGGGRGRGGGRGGGGGIDAGLINEFSKSIKKGFQEEITRLITQLKTAPGGAGGDEGVAATAETFGSMAAAAKTADERLQNLNDLIKKSTVPQIAAWNKLFLLGLLAEWNQTIRELNFSMQSLATTLKRNVLDFFKGSFREGMELSRTGLVNLHDVFIDTAAAISEQRDNIVLTMKSINAAIDKGLVTPLGTFGTTVKEVGKGMADLRDAIGEEGFAVSSAFKSLEDANVALQTLVTSDLRAGVKSDIRDSVTQMRFANQLEQLRLIGSLSGKQLEEMINQRQQTDKEFNVLVRQGLLSEKDADQAKLLYDFFKSRGDQDTANQIKLLAETGAMNDGLSTAMAAMTDEQRLGVALNRELNQGFLDVIKGGGDLRKMTGELLNIQTDVRGQGEAAVIQQKLGTKQMALVAQGIDVANAQQLDEAIRKFEESQKTVAATADDHIRNFMQHVEQFITPALWSLVVTSGIIAARMGLGLGAQLFRFLRGGGAATVGAAGVGRAVTGLARTGIPAIGAAGAGIAGVGAAGAAGGLARGAGGLLGKLVPGLGTVLSGGLALRSFMSGDIIGGLLHSGSGVASLFPGIGTAIAAGLSGAAIGREILSPPTAGGPGVGPAPTAVPSVTAASGSPQRMVMEHMQAQTRYLNRLVTLSEESNTIGQGISDRIGRPERAALVREGRTPGTAAPVYEGDLSAGALS